MYLIKILIIGNYIFSLELYRTQILNAYMCHNSFLKSRSMFEIYINFGTKGLPAKGLLISLPKHICTRDCLCQLSPKIVTKEIMLELTSVLIVYSSMYKVNVIRSFHRTVIVWSRFT